MKKKLYRWFSSFLVAVLLIPIFTATALAADRTIIQSSGAKMPDIVCVGEKYTLKASGTGTVKFYSSDTEIATVGETRGVLRLKAPGKVTISAKDKDGKKVALKILTVKQRATAVSADVETLYLTPGDTYTLAATLTPSNSTDVIRFRSNRIGIATVGVTNGVVTAKSAGEATITVYAKKEVSTAYNDSENRKATVQVIVRKKALTAEVVGENQIKATFTENTSGVTAENFSVTQTIDGSSKALGIVSAVQYSSCEFLLTLAEPVFSTTETSAAALVFTAPDDETYVSRIDLGEKVVYSPSLASATVSGNNKIEEGTSGFLQFFGVDQNENPYPLEPLKNVVVYVQSYVDTSSSIVLTKKGEEIDNVSFRYKQLNDGSMVITYAAPPDTVVEGTGSTRFLILLRNTNGYTVCSRVIYVTRAKEGTKHTLRFVSSEGEELFDALTVRAGTEYSTPTPGREGYTFKGWTRSDGAEGSVMPEQNLTLTAVWEEIGSTPTIHTTSVATVSTADWVYGSPASPTLSNCPADTLKVTYQYKPAGAGDTAWSNTVPTALGGYQVRAIIEVTEDYKVMTAAADFSIEPKEVTISGTAVAPSKVYDGNNTAEITDNGTLDGVVDGDDVYIIPGTAAYDDETVGTDKEVTFTGFALGGADKDNYVLASQPAPVTADIAESENDVISVDIVWDSMDFTYTAESKGIWNPATHKYENATEGGWATEGGNFTVENNGNTDIIANFSYTSAQEMSKISGSFTANSLTVDAGKSKSTKLNLSGKPPEELDNRELGTVSINVCKYGWANINEKYYYFDSDGTMSVGWKNDIPGWEGQWFYFDSNGAMSTGWKNDIPGWEGQWFYFDEDSGTMCTGWADNIPEYDGIKFYFGDDGVMRTGWVEVDGTWYYFDENGHLVKSSPDAPDKSL